MNHFIEVHSKGERRMVNLAHVEEVIESEDGSGACTIYFAFNAKGYLEQDYVQPEESYEEVKRMILRA